MYSRAVTIAIVGLAFASSSLLTFSMASSVTVSTNEELQSAIDNASPGDVITLAPVTFTGEFIAKKSGSESSPITVVASSGSDKSKLVGSGSGVAFHILGNFWSLKYFSISDYSVAVLVSGNKNTLESLAIFKVKKAVTLDGEDNTVSNTAIHTATLGIEVKGKSSHISGNSVDDANPSILIEGGACCGTLENNVASGQVQVKGNKYMVDGNVFKSGIHVTGCDNTFSMEVDPGSNFTKDCENKDTGNNIFD